MKITTTTTIRQKILEGKSLTEEEFIVWSNRYMLDETPDLTTDELQHYVECYPEQFETILNTHDPDIISHWYTISSVGWYSLNDPDVSLAYDRGQVYIQHVPSPDNSPADDSPPFPADDNLDWL